MNKRSVHRKICNSADSLAGIEDHSWQADDIDDSSVLTADDAEDSVVDAPEAAKTGLRRNGAQAPLSRPQTTTGSAEVHQAHLIVELLAKEMAATLLRETSILSLTSKSHDKSQDSTADSSSEKSNSAVGAIAAMVIKSVRQRQAKTGGDFDLALQLLLQQEIDAVKAGESGRGLDGTMIETLVSGSSSTTEFPALPASAASTTVSDSHQSLGVRIEQGEQGGSGEIVWTPTFTDATPKKQKAKDPIASPPLGFEPKTWSAQDFSSKNRTNTDVVPLSIDSDNADELVPDGEDDDLSVVSDLTGLTGAFTKSEASKNRTKNFSLTDSDSFKAFTGERQTFVDRTMYAPVSIRHLTVRKKEGQHSLASTESNRSVSFSHVLVRNYERIMNDNPASAAGPSIGIGWKFVEADPVRVDTFEKGQRSRSDSLTDLQLSKATRLKLVRELGYTEKDIAANVRELNKSRRNRKQTVDNLGVEKMEEAFERVRRKVKQMFVIQRQPSQSSLETSRTPSIEQLYV